MLHSPALPALPARATLLALGLSLVACTPGPPAPSAAAITTTAPGSAPPDAPPGTCWARDVTPAVVEVVTEHVLAKPAEIADDGTILVPARYDTRSVQRIVEPRREFHFEVPCDNVLTPDFIAALQRALAARGLYDGPLSGQLDAATRRAIRAFQRPAGLDSDILILESARKLGLVAYGRETLRR